MTTALQIATPPKLNAAVTAALFGPLILRAQRASGLQTGAGGGALAATLHEAALSGWVLTEKDLRAAVCTELGIRHGCAVTRLAPVAAAGSLLAVEFDADVIARGRVDPVDVLAIVPVHPFVNDKLEYLGNAVRDMLAALATRPGGLLGQDTRERDRRLAHVVDDLRRVAGVTRYDLTQEERLLFERVCAADIALCVRAAQPGGAA